MAPSSPLSLSCSRTQPPPIVGRIDAARTKTIRLICLAILFIVKGLLNSSGNIEVFYILGYMKEGKKGSP